MWSNQYIKIPFLDLGRSRHGADCWGLVRIVFEEQKDIILPSYDEYAHTLDKDSVSKTVNKVRSMGCWKEVYLGEEQEFDIPVFRISGFPMHVGIVIKRGQMLHCQRGCGTYISDYVNDQEWSRRLIGIYRYAPSTDSPSTIP